MTLLNTILPYWPVITVLGGAVYTGVRWGVRLHSRVATVEKDAARKTEVAELSTKLTDLKEQTNRIDNKIDKLLLRGL